MRRIFGSSKKEQPAPQPTLDELANSIDTRVEGINSKIMALERDMVNYRNKMEKTNSASMKNSLKQKLLQLLKQKKTYENQRDQLQNQSWNIQQTSFHTNAIQDKIVEFNALKSAKTLLEKKVSQIDLDQVEDLQDDLNELLNKTEDIGQLFAREISPLGEIDEGELEAELMSIEAELTNEDAESSQFSKIIDQIVDIPEKLCNNTGTMKNIDINTKVVNNS